MFENQMIPKELFPSDPRFGVGPSLIPLSAVKSLLDSKYHLLGTSHRKSPIKNLVKEIQEGLRHYFQLPDGYEVVLGNGGATFLWDMIGLGLVERSSLHFICGEFSDKWYRSHTNIPWIQTKAHRVEYGEGIEVREEEGFDFISCTLNETSTGVQLSSLPELKNEKTLLGMDATSGAGQMKVDFKRVDVYYFSPQKVFASEGGLYVAILSPKAVARAEKVAREEKRFIPESMSWIHALKNSQTHETYNTPSISTIFFLKEQLKAMNELGEERVISLGKIKADFIYDWAQSKPYLTPFVKEAMYRSPTVATIDVDKKYLVDDLCRVLRERDFAYDIEGYRKLNRNQLRLSLFHNVSLENLEKLTKVVSLMIENQF